MSTHKIFTHCTFGPIFTFLLISSSLFAQKAFDIQWGKKAIVSADKLYVCTIDESRNMGVNLLAANVKDEHSIRKYFLPLTVTSQYYQYPLSWDIADGHFFSISTWEIHHAQRSFRLVRIPLEKLQRYEKAEKGMVPFLQDVFVNVKPLSDTFLAADIKETGPVYYDFYAINKDSIELYILSNKQMNVFRYENNKWLNVAMFNSTFNEYFEVIKKDRRVFLLTDKGKLFFADGLHLDKVGKVTLKLVEEISDKYIKFAIVDKNLNNVFLASDKELIDLSDLTIKKTVEVEIAVDVEDLMKEVLKYLPTIYGF